MRGCGKLVSLTGFGYSTLHQTCISETAVSSLPRVLRGLLAESSQQNVRQVCQPVFRCFAASSTTSSAMAASSAGSAERLSVTTLIQLYKQLSKHRLSALVVSTAAAGYIAGAWNRSACLTYDRLGCQD